jgi:cytoskeletal protein CcmA (bactofilin family)
MPDKTTGLSIIHQGLKVEGILSAEGKLIIGGAVEGTLIGDEVVIAEGSHVVARAKVREMLISGDFEGDVTAYETLKIMPTGNFRGNIVCKNLSLQAGGRLNGSVQPLEAKEEIIEPDTGGEDVSGPG